MSAHHNDFIRLVRMVARLFYAEEVPPAEAPLPDEVPTARKAKPPQGPQPGLGVIVLDALTRREWVQEDYVPRNVEGEPPDTKPPGLAQQLRLHPKLLRRVLRHFEQEQIVAREHRREAAKRRRRAGEPVPDAAAASMLAGQTAIQEEEGEAQPRHLMHSYCCIDYPRFIDVLQLRMVRMRERLSDAGADKAPVQSYACPRCGSTYSSLDAARIVDFSTGELVCEDCGTVVVQQFASGDMGDEAERRRRREASRALLRQFDATVKPVKDLLARLRNQLPPDYGPLQDWAIARQAEAVRQQRGGRGGGGGGPAFPTIANVEVDMGDGDNPAAAAEEEAPKVLPPWMLRDGVDSAGAGPSSAPEAMSAEDVAREAAERDAIERAYVQAWLARANALGEGGAVDTDDKRAAVAGESKPEEQQAKRVKTEGDWAAVDVKPELAAVKQEQPSAAVKPEPGVQPAVEDGALEWEDAAAAAAADGLAVEADASLAAGGGDAGGDDELDWEDV